MDGSVTEQVDGNKAVSVRNDSFAGETAEKRIFPSVVTEDVLTSAVDLTDGTPPGTSLQLTVGHDVAAFRMVGVVAGLHPVFIPVESLESRGFLCEFKETFGVEVDSARSVASGR